MKRDDVPGFDDDAGKSVDHGRRIAMQKIAIGVGVLAGYSVLPEQWTRPIIGQIILPAHAATSGSSLHDPCSVELLDGDNTTEGVTVNVTGFVTPPVANIPVTITAAAVGGANRQVQVRTKTSAEGTFGATMTIGGGPGITRVNVTTAATGADGVANCSVLTTSEPSNVCSASAVLGRWHARGTEPTNYPETIMTLGSGGAVTDVEDGVGVAQLNGTWSLSGNVLTIVLPFVDGELTGTTTYVLTLSADCQSATGRVNMQASDGQTDSMDAEGSQLAR